MFIQLLNADFHTQVSRKGGKQQRHTVNSSHKRMARWIGADRKDTATSLTTFYDYGEQKSISEHTRDQ